MSEENPTEYLHERDNYRTKKIPGRCNWYSHAPAYNPKYRLFNWNTLVEDEREQKRFKTKFFGIAPFQRLIYYNPDPKRGRPKKESKQTKSQLEFRREGDKKIIVRNIERKINLNFSLMKRDMRIELNISQHPNPNYRITYFDCRDFDGETLVFDTPTRCKNKVKGDRYCGIHEKYQIDTLKEKASKLMKDIDDEDIDESIRNRSIEELKEIVGVLLEVQDTRIKYILQAWNNETYRECLENDPLLKAIFAYSIPIMFDKKTPYIKQLDALIKIRETILKESKKENIPQLPIIELRQ